MGVSRLGEKNPRRRDLTQTRIGKDSSNSPENTPDFLFSLVNSLSRRSCEKHLNVGKRTSSRAEIAGGGEK